MAGSLSLPAWAGMNAYLASSSTAMMPEPMLRLPSRSSSRVDDHKGALSIGKSQEAHSLVSTVYSICSTSSGSGSGSGSGRVREEQRQ